MEFKFSPDVAEQILETKRRVLGRGLSYAEKILFLHEAKDRLETLSVRGKDQLKLYPDRVLMQDATAQMAMLQFIMTGRKKSAVSATIHCDHLLRADKGADADLKAALTTNHEVYEFLASAAKKYGIGFWKPGSGIMHQVILENYVLPGNLMIGTDSHTPNGGGLGAIAIGVGGADAAEVMAGLAWEVTHPKLVGVRLLGKLSGWASAKDIIFEMLKRFTVKGGTGKIFEYFGPGAEALSATQKATITNMGAELGATSSVFVYDGAMDAYLRNVGRVDDADHIRMFAHCLTQDPECVQHPERVFDELVDIDLGTIPRAHAGPYSPDRITPVKDMRRLLELEKWPENVSAVLLGSCTNSSYSDLYAAAQVLSQASEKGVKPGAPIMFSPGSTRIYETIKRDGILDKITGAGATVLTASCGPCIGQWDRRDVETGVPNCLFTTFNRNFRGRNDANPETKAFLTSPAMAAALALSGSASFNPETDPLTGADGHEFFLSPPTPPALPAHGLAETSGTYIAPDTDGDVTELRINPDSERIQLITPFDAWDGNDLLDVPILVKTKGKTTTDHISPGGKWLRFRGHLPNISRNLLSGAENAFTGEIGKGTNVVSNKTGIEFSVLASYYKENTNGFVIVGDENYGEGSSREHAAMSPRFMGARAVIARSFARIHETNLKKQGILALTFQSAGDYDLIGEFDRISIIGLDDFSPGKPLRAIISKRDHGPVELNLDHTFTHEQIQWFRAGASLNLIGNSG